MSRPASHREDARGSAGKPAGRFRRRLLLLPLLCLLLPAVRADLGAAFEEANLLYGQGHPREAANAYDRLWTNGFSSTALHYNLGNAWFKAGETGRAIHHYRLAEKLDPRDPDVAANLELARMAVQGGGPTRRSLSDRLTGWLSLNEWTAAAGTGLWVWIGLLIAGQFRPEWRSRLNLAIRCSAAATGLFALLLLLAWTRHPAVEAIVLDHNVTLHHGPLEESPEVESLAAGQELAVLDRKGDWVQVGGAARGIGWVLKDQVALLPR